MIGSKALRILMKQLRVEAAKGQYETPISTNMGMEFTKLVDDLGYEFAAENFIAHFSTDEQASVRMVFQTHEYNIKTDFGLDTGEVTEHPADASIDQRLEEWAKQLV